MKLTSKHLLSFLVIGAIMATAGMQILHTTVEPIGWSYDAHSRPLGTLAPFTGPSQNQMSQQNMSTKIDRWNTQAEMPREGSATVNGLSSLRLITLFFFGGATGVLTVWGISFTLNHRSKMAARTTGHAAGPLSDASADSTSENIRLSLWSGKQTDSIEQPGSATDASRPAQPAHPLSETSRHVLLRLIISLKMLCRSSKQIADSIDMINDIAFQSSLLARSVEAKAARASEHSYRLAVVAADIRHLAKRSATVATEIKDLFNQSFQRMSDSNEFVDHSGRTLREIVISAHRATHILSKTMASSQKQANRIDFANSVGLQANDLPQRNATLSGQADKRLREQTVLLEKLIEALEKENWQPQETACGWMPPELRQAVSLGWGKGEGNGSAWNHGDRKRM